MISTVCMTCKLFDVYQDPDDFSDLPIDRIIPHPDNCSTWMCHDGTCPHQNNMDKVIQKIYEFK